MERRGKLGRSEAFHSLEEDNNVFTKMLISLVGEFLSFGAQQIRSLYHQIKLRLQLKGDETLSREPCGRLPSL